MTAGSASTSVFHRLIVYGKDPLTIGKIVGDVHRIITGMDIVTGFTGTSLVILVDVTEMKVMLSITKTGESAGFLCESCGFFMAAKAKLLHPERKGGVELLGEVLSDKPPII